MIILAMTVTAAAAGNDRQCGSKGRTGLGLTVCSIPRGKPLGQFTLAYHSGRKESICHRRPFMSNWHLGGTRPFIIPFLTVAASGARTGSFDGSPISESPEMQVSHWFEENQKWAGSFIDSYSFESSGSIALLGIGLS
ncbi:hypothetical protein LIER_35267 [Lithospermum erythrorhizon]|uniref:Uncharacterized protein n=1 Tax=Lithospermum erythrorhizon TaxID=34254 RepID=A0AAV3NNX8_LITER